MRDELVAAIAQELERHQIALNDPTLITLTVVVKIDHRTRKPGTILFRPEHSRTYGRPL